MRIICFAILFFPAVGVAQELQHITSFKIDRPVAASLDRKGSLFVAEKSGNINKYDPNGNLELTYSGFRNSKIELIEAWSTLDVLVFYSGFQSVTVLNRFLSPITEISLEGKAGFARLATFNYESNLWVIDDTDFSLKLLDLSLNQVTINTSLNQILDPNDYDISYMREYQNLLFIVDVNTGILIFDNLGNYLQTIAVMGIDFIGFVDNQLYYSKGNQLIFRDIYSDFERLINMPAGGLALATSSKIYLLKEKGVEVYTY